MTFQLRCQRALAAVLLSQGINVEAGYTPDVQSNLLHGCDLHVIREDFEGGAGLELDWKMRAAHSSSALVVNTFARWRRDPSTLSLAGETGYDSIRFEARCPSGLGGTPPHLDLLGTRTDRIVAVESKCTEHLAEKQARFTASYNSITDGRSRSPWFTVLRQLRSSPSLYKWLDAAQLIKHYLGLTRCYPGARITLLYLYWEPVNWGEFPLLVEHRSEIERFALAVSGDATVRFTPQSYPVLWQEWGQWREPSWLPEHICALRRRYSVSISGGG